MAFFSSNQDPNDPLQVHDHITDEGEAYFRDTMNKLSIAYGDEWSSLSKKQILILEKTLASGVCWYSAFLSQEDNEIDVESFYKVYKDAVIRLDAYFTPVQQVSDELRQQVFDIVDSKSSISLEKAAKTLGISLDLFESIMSEHPKVRKEDEFDICYGLLICGMHDPERMAALVGTTIDFTNEIVNRYWPFFNPSRFKKKRCD